MGLIEQAAKRLEELKRAGVEVPAEAERPAAAPARDEPVVPIHRPEPASRRPGPPAVTIDLAALETRGFIVPDAPRSRLADEFRILKRPLLGNAGTKPGTGVKNGNLIMVTSAIPGEGKTFTSLNLAMSIAMELDRSVVLVDGDVARASLPKALNLQPQRGLLDVLGGAVELSQAVLPTNVPRLSLLMAGTPNARAAEMLASGAMSQLLEELAQRPDRVVVFDSPPLLATTEARQLASRMGQIVFVVHAETTRQTDVQQALATIESCPIKLLVLNGATSAAQGAYGYGYGYGYGE